MRIRRQRDAAAIRPRPAALVLLALVITGLIVAILLRPVRPSPLLLVGVDDDTVKWIDRPDVPLASYRELGVSAVRIWIPWHGEARPGGVTETYLARAQNLALHGERVVLAVFGFAGDAPLTATAQHRFCGFARRALARVPSARDVVVWNEANNPTYWPRAAGAPRYASLLARCWDALHAERPDANALDSTASHHNPAAFLAALGAAYRSSGRTRRLVDTFGHNPYPLGSREPPSARHTDGTLGQGDYGELLGALRLAFAGTPQPLPGSGGVTVWYLEDGFQSSVPPGKRHLYSGRENDAATATALLQADHLGASLRLAACQASVGAYFNFELTDEARLVGWQSGLLWPDGTRKPAFAALRRAAAEIRAGRVDCQ
ncbi:MAG: hypothetical protein ABR569_05520 [Gaiellaceae bacterium]